MLSKEYRLKKKKDFDRVFRQGRSIYQKECGIHFIKNGLENSRFAFVVSAKIFKKAVQRNRIRRIMSEFVRLNLEKIIPNYDVAIVVRSSIKEQDRKEIKKNIIKIFKKAGLMYEK